MMTQKNSSMKHLVIGGLSKFGCGYGGYSYEK